MAFPVEFGPNHDPAYSKKISEGLQDSADQDSVSGKVVETAKKVGSYIKDTAEGLAKVSPPGVAVETWRGKGFGKGTMIVPILSHLDPSGNFAATMDAAAKSDNPLMKAGAASVAGMVSVGEWASLNEAGRAIEFASDAAVQGMSKLFRMAFTRSAQTLEAVPAENVIASAVSGEAAMGEDALMEMGGKSARMQRIGRITRGAVVGTGLGAAQAGAQKAAGEKPDWRSSMTFGAILGMAGGIYSPKLHARLQQKLPQMYANMAPEQRATLDALDSVAAHLMNMGGGKGGGLRADEAALRLLSAMDGTASDGTRQGIQAVLEAHPELLRHPEVAALARMVKDYATPEIYADPSKSADSPIRITYEDAKRNIQVKTVTANQLERFDNLSKQGKIYMHRVEGPAAVLQGRYDNVVNRPQNAMFAKPSEAQLTAMLDAMDKGTYVNGLFGGKRGIIPRTGETPMPTDISGIMGIPETLAPKPRLEPGIMGVPEPKATELGPYTKSAATTYSLIGDKPGTAQPNPYDTYGNTFELPEHQIPEFNPPAIAIGKPSMGGTPIAAPGVEAVVPTANSPLEVPSAPEFARPRRLTKGQKKIFGSVAFGKAEDLEKAIKGKEDAKNFLHLTLTGTIKPEDVRDPTMAHMIGTKLQDFSLPKMKLPSLRDVNAIAKAPTESERAMKIAQLMPPESYSPEQEMVKELGWKYHAQAYRLKGETPPDFSYWTRDPHTADIVRTVKHTPMTTMIVDKHGRLVIEDTNDVEPARVATIDDVPDADALGITEARKGIQRTMRAKVAGREAGEAEVSRIKAKVAANHFKKLETMAGSDERPVSLNQSKSKRGARKDVPPQPIIQEPVKTTNSINNADAAEFVESRRQTYEEAKSRLDQGLGDTNDKNFTSLYEKLRDFLKSGSKGAITIPRGVAVDRGPIARFAKKAGYKMWALPEGTALIDADGHARVFPSAVHAADFLTKSVTASRVMAEQNQVIEEGVAHIPTINHPGLSPLVDTIHQLTGEQATRTSPKLTAWGAHGFRMQKTVLATFGAPGRWLSSASDMFHAGREMADRTDLTIARNAINKLRGMGVSPAQIEDGTADPSAIKIYEEEILPIFNRQFEDASVFGLAGDPVTDKLYVPHSRNFTMDDVDETTLKEFAENGIVGNKDEVAKMLNDPTSVPVPEPGKGMTTQDLMVQQGKHVEQMNWVRDRAISLEGSLQKNRNVKIGPAQEWQQFEKIIRGRNRRIMEAAVFGPSRERMYSAIGQIAGTPSFTSAMHDQAVQIMHDVLGQKRIEIGRLQRGAMDLARGMLGMSFSRHFVQGGMLANEAGFIRTARGMLRGVGAILQNTKEATNAAAGLDHTRFDITSDEAIQASEVPAAIFEKVAEKWGRIGSYGLHATINTIRRTAFHTGKVWFNDIFDKALKGDATSLALLKDGFHGLKFDVTPEQLRGMDRKVLSDLFAKNLADWTGFTFRPQDMPAIARSTGGRWLLQFRSYMFQSSANWWNSVTDKHIPRRIRAARVARMMLTVPVIAYADASLRKKVGAESVTNEEMLQAWDRMHEHPTLGRAIDVAAESMIDTHLLGWASDLVQGAATLDSNMIERSESLQAAAVSLPIDLALAGLYAYQSHLDGDPKEADAAYRSLASILGSPGVAAYRKRIGQTTIRMPKHEMFRETGDALDRLLSGNR